MKNSVRLIVPLAAATALAFSAQAAGKKATGKQAPVLQIPMAVSPGTFDSQKYLEDMAVTYDSLANDAALLSSRDGVAVSVAASELSPASATPCESCGEVNVGDRKVRVGVVKDADLLVDLGSARAASLGTQATPMHHGVIRGVGDGSVAWTTRVSSPGASALRVHIDLFSLPQNAGLFIYNRQGEVFGPYMDLGPNEDGDFWTNTVRGDEAFLELRVFGPVSQRSLNQSGFHVAGVAHMGANFIPAIIGTQPAEPSLKSFCSYNASCVLDAKCYTTSTWAPIEDVRKAVGHMLFVSGAYYYICTGTLLNDTVTTSYIPYFLSANHCISKSTEAKSLEVYWNYWTSSCGSACYDPYSTCPRTVGSSLLSHNSTNSDYTFLQLSQAPPAGAVYLGWNATAVANTNGTALYRISHPQGAPQAFSRHTVNTTASTCRSWPRGKWIYSKDTLGATEGGSSGSSVCNASGQVVGHLSGACGTNLNDVCDSVKNSTVDGAFANYYPSIKGWLAP